MLFNLKGVHVPHRKHTQNKPAERLAPPSKVSIPMSMHIGKPSTPIVKIGDKVKVGTKIAEASGYISVPIHSSVSGTVKSIEDKIVSNGSVVPMIVIESDGNMQPDESVYPPVINSKQDFIDAVKESGIVGLGGAGFPTHVKLNVDTDKVDCVIINCAECEPYVTSDTLTMVNSLDDIKAGLDALAKYLGIKKVIIGIESNKKDAITSMKKLISNHPEGCDVSVKVLPAIYPQGGEKVLIYHTTGRIVSKGKLPIDVGCIVINCTTLAAIGGYVTRGMPLVEKVVTVDGGAVTEPKNVIAPIGASFSDLFEYCGGFKTEPVKLLYGGPMMGIAVPGADEPILKNTNAILALTAKEAELPQTTACIRCGACINTCPIGLAPANISGAYDSNDVEMLKKLHVDLCMECGCCSFVCPANRPLVQKNKLSKVLLRQSETKEDKN